MKIILPTLTLLGSLLAPLSSADTLHIVVDNIQDAEGSIMLEILAGEAEFAGERSATAALVQRAQSGSMKFATSNLAPGEYAVRVMHDVNGNNELDTNLLGIPKEPWAFSNNATGRMGPPKWQAVKFSLQGNSTQTITLNR